MRIWYHKPWCYTMLIKPCCYFAILICLGFHAYVVCFGWIIFVWYGWIWWVLLNQLLCQENLMKYAYAVLVGNAMLLYAGRVLCRCLNENALAMLLINHDYDDDIILLSCKTSLSRICSWSCWDCMLYEKPSIAWKPIKFKLIDCCYVFVLKTCQMMMLAVVLQL